MRRYGLNTKIVVGQNEAYKTIIYRRTISSTISRPTNDCGTVVDLYPDRAFEREGVNLTGGIARITGGYRGHRHSRR